MISDKKIESILSLNIRFFYHPDFDKKSKHKDIISDIPDFDLFKKEQVKVEKMRQTNKASELRPCYEEPLLSREQEYHLFKKMNFYKYNIKKLINRLKRQKQNKILAREIEDLIQEYLKIRNKIANSNFRLASFVISNNSKKFKNFDSEISLSDAFLDIVKSVDYFNFTLGNKFSTYCVWVLRKNFFRGIQEQSIKDLDCISFDENFDELIPSKEDYNFDLNRKENAFYINKIIKSIKGKIRCKDIKRQIGIVESYYGLNGKSRKNLEQISLCLGITKERVRQLKEKFLSYMRETIQIHGKEYVI